MHQPHPTSKATTRRTVVRSAWAAPVVVAAAAAPATAASAQLPPQVTVSDIGSTGTGLNRTISMRFTNAAGRASATALTATVQLTTQLGQVTGYPADASTFNGGTWRLTSHTADTEPVANTPRITLVFTCLLVPVAGGALRQLDFPIEVNPNATLGLQGAVAVTPAPTPGTGVPANGTFS